MARTAICAMLSAAVEALRLRAVQVPGRTRFKRLVTSGTHASWRGVIFQETVGVSVIGAVVMVGASLARVFIVEWTRISADTRTAVFTWHRTEQSHVAELKENSPVHIYSIHS